MSSQVTTSSVNPERRTHALYPTFVRACLRRLSKGAAGTRSPGEAYAEEGGLTGEVSEVGGVSGVAAFATDGEACVLRGARVIVALLTSAAEDSTAVPPPAATSTGCSSGTFTARFQSVESWQCLQYRTMPSLITRTSDSTSLCSTVSCSLQALHSSSTRRSSFSLADTGAKSISQKSIISVFTKATP